MEAQRVIWRFRYENRHVHTNWCITKYLSAIELDEPSQHHMTTKNSQLVLLQKFLAKKIPQGIVNASFNGSRAAYNAATHNVQSELTSLVSKAIVPGGAEVLAGHDETWAHKNRRSIIWATIHPLLVTHSPSSS